jgi:AraC-like DNA-binding protein
MKLLKDSDKTINEIALITGFSTANYYHIVFKKKVGMTPQQYRNSRL